MRWKVASTIVLLTLCFGSSAARGQTEEEVWEVVQLQQQMSQLSQQGKYAEAARLAERIVAMQEKVLGPEHPGTANALSDLASVYSSMKEFDKALSLYHRALAIKEKVLGPEHPDTVSSLTELATVYVRIGKYTKALPLWQRVVAIREKVLGPEHPVTAHSLIELARVYSLLGELTKALPLSKRAEAILNHIKGPEDQNTVKSLAAQAAIYLAMGNDAQALPLLQRALAIREKVLGPEHPDTAQSLDNLARYYQHMGDDAKALPLQQRALAIAEKVLGLEHPLTAAFLDSLTGAYKGMGDDAKALPLYQRALAIMEKWGPEHPITAHLLNNLAVLYEKMGDYAQALQFFQRALAVEDRTFSNVFAVSTEEQKYMFTERFDRSYRGALSLIRRHFQGDATAVRFGLELVLRRKGIVLDAQSRTQQTLAASLEGETLRAWQRLTQARSEFSRLSLSDLEEHNPAEHKQQLEELQAAITREEEFLAQHSGRLAQEFVQRKVTAQMLAKHLPQNSALVEFVCTWEPDEDKLAWSNNCRYLAFVLTPDSQVRLVDLGEADEMIDGKVSEALGAIDDSDLLPKDLTAYTKQADTKLAELYDVLVRPLEAALGSSRRLIVSPDGELSRVPFAALRTPDGHYLIEKMAVSYVASGRDLLRDESREPATMDLLLVANPAFDDRNVLRQTSVSEEAIRAGDYGERFAPLPGTIKEASVIPPLLQGTQKVLQGTKATETAVRSTKSPKILHLATHGFFLNAPPEPLRSAVDVYWAVRWDPFGGDGRYAGEPHGALGVSTGRRESRQGNHDRR